VAITEKDIVDFVNVKRDSVYAILELYTYAWLKRKYKGKVIAPWKCFDFAAWDLKGTIVYEVKHNHYKLSWEQLVTAWRLYESREINALYIMSNVKTTVEYLKLEETFETYLGIMYCYKMDFVKVNEKYHIDEILLGESLRRAEQEEKELKYMTTMLERIFRELET